MFSPCRLWTGTNKALWTGVTKHSHLTISIDLSKPCRGARRFVSHEFAFKVPIRVAELRARAEILTQSRRLALQFFPLRGRLPPMGAATAVHCSLVLLERPTDQGNCVRSRKYNGDDRRACVQMLAPMRVRARSLSDFGGHKCNSPL